MLRDFPGWPGEEAQAELLSACLHHTRSFPLSVKYMKSIVKLIEKDCEDAMEDSLAEFIVDFHSNVRVREAENGEEDRAFYSYLIPDSGDTSTESFSIVPLRCIRDNNLVGLKVWEAGLALTEVLIDSAGAQLIEDKAVIELGAGVGNTGILVAKHVNMKSLVMTDFNDEILENLQYNVDLNMKRGLCCQDIRVDFCDWRATGDQQVERGEVQRYGKSQVILAADCTYSMDICTHLVGSIRALLEHSKKEELRRSTHDFDKTVVSDPVEAQKRFGPIAIVAAVERNEETYAHFLATLDESRPRLKHFDCTAFAMAACARTPLFCYGYKEKLRFICVHLV